MQQNEAVTTLIIRKIFMLSKKVNGVLIMKKRSILKALIFIAIAVCLIACVFIPAFSAENESSEELKVIDSVRPIEDGELWFAVQLDPKYVRVSDLPGISVSTTDRYTKETTVADIGKNDYIIERKNMPEAGECFIVYIRHRAINACVWIVIAENSFFDTEGNGNQQLSSYNNAGLKGMYSYRKYDGSYFNEEPVYRDVTMAYGDKIQIKLGGTFSDEYEVYLSDKLISKGQSTFDMTFDEPGDKVLRICYNDIYHEELPITVMGKSETKMQNLSEGWSLITSGMSLLPLGLLFMLSPLTLLPGAAILSGPLEGISQIVRTLFIW